MERKRSNNNPEVERSSLCLSNDNLKLIVDYVDNDAILNLRVTSKTLCKLCEARAASLWFMIQGGQGKDMRKLKPAVAVRKRILNLTDCISLRNVNLNKNPELINDSAERLKVKFVDLPVTIYIYIYIHEHIVTCITCN
mmetsp:Transcript_12675/g.14396  ORF Transcript_12675/g.14396 Transcript_12675/m.14396 type:complete len:139 (-) Transcript_12675:1364-1780(-)